MTAVHARLHLILSALALFGPAPALPTGQIPFSNTVLVYCDPGRDWAAGSFDYYLAYIGKDGTPRDRLFDGFLFLSINALSKRNFWDGRADTADWDWWLERIFEPGRQLDALENDAQALDAKLGPGAPRRVIISIPRPPVAADAAGQETVIRQFVDRCVRRFAVKGYRHVALDGFYWFHEGVDGTNADLVNSLERDLRGRGLRLYWIPYDVGHENRAHLEKWKAGDIRFDGVWLQPNYFWADRNAKYAAQDLDDTVSFARSMGSEVEIEFDHGVYTTGWKLGRYIHYLMSADVYGYRNGPLMYYDGYMGYIKCGQSRNPVHRAVYDDLYWFRRKAYLPKSMTYPGVFFEAGSATDPARHPEIGLWVGKGGGGRIDLVEPDPNKDYLVILKTTGPGKARLEVLGEGSRAELEGMEVAGGGGRDAVRLERYRLPRGLIQKAWKSKTTLVVALRRTGGGTITEAWARPDDFVFRYLKGQQPMETEARLDFNRRTAVLRNLPGETVIGLRLTDGAGGAGKAGLSIADGPSRAKRVSVDAGSGKDILWTTGKPDSEGGITIQLDPGTEISELWAFPKDAEFHLRPGSSGDTCPDLHAPGVGLVPDGKWRLAGEFWRNHRTGAAGAALRVAAPSAFQSWSLSLLIDASTEVSADIRQDGSVKGTIKIAACSSRRITIPIKDGEYVVRFAGPVTLHDAWLAPR